MRVPRYRERELPRGQMGRGCGIGGLQGVAVLRRCQGNGQNDHYRRREGPEVNVPYSVETADKAMNEGKVVFLSGGTGKPFFTTDTAATMRAIELKVDAILMGKNGVEGVYDKDPRTNADAKFFPVITYQEMIKQNLQIMDQTALELIKDKDIQVRVFRMDADNFIAAAKGENVGTVCRKGE